VLSFAAPLTQGDGVWAFASRPVRAGTPIPAGPSD
jgi:hypothetical protein